MLADILAEAAAATLGHAVALWWLSQKSKHWVTCKQKLKPRKF